MFWKFGIFLPQLPRLLEPDRQPADRYHIMLDGRLFLPAASSFLSGANPRHFCVEQFVGNAAINASLGVVICNAEAPMMPGQHMMSPLDMVRLTSSHVCYSRLH